MDWQVAIVGAAVLAAAAYATWTLMPVAARKVLLSALRHPRMPAGVRQWASTATSAATCGGGCSACSQPSTAAEKPLVFHPRDCSRDRRFK